MNQQPDAGGSAAGTDRPAHPNQHFVNVVASACAGHHERVNRAKLRRALRRCDDAPLDVLRIVGPALSPRDTADEITLKVGVAALYATHGHHPGTAWRTVGHVLRLGGDDRSGRELQKLKHRLDRGDPAAAMQSLRLMFARLDDAAVATLDWGLLLADLRNLLQGRHSPKAKAAWHRWCVGFARGDDNTDDAAPPTSDPPTTGDTSEPAAASTSRQERPNQ